MLFVSHDLTRDGAPLSLLKIARRQAGLGLARAALLALRDGPLRAAWQEAGVPVHVIAAGPAALRSGKAFAAGLEQVTRFIGEVRPDVVHANTLHAFPAVLAASGLALPAIWNIRESEAWWSAFNDWPSVARPAALRAFAAADRVIFVSRASMESWSDVIDPSKASVIVNGIDHHWIASSKGRLTRDQARSIQGLAPEECAIIAVGRICERKGQLDLLAALPLLPESPRVRVLLLGAEDEYYGKLARQAYEVLPDRWKASVRFLGGVEDVTPWLAASDILVSTSRRESHPRVVLEAMGFGLPVIAVPAFGIKEQFLDGEGGLYYSAGDVQGLADKLIMLMDQPFREVIGQRAAAIAARHPDWDDTARAYAAAYQDVMASRRGSAGQAEP